VAPNTQEDVLLIYILRDKNVCMIVYVINLSLYNCFLFFSFFFFFFISRLKRVAPNTREDVLFKYALHDKNVCMIFYVIYSIFIFIYLFYFYFFILFYFFFFFL
jgi:hypothetical protein